MEVMFAGCWRLTNLDLSHFDTSKVMYRDSMFATCKSLNHLVLGSKIILTEFSELPTLPAKGTRIPDTNKIVLAPYWIATSGFQQGGLYTAEKLEQLTGRNQVTTYDWASKLDTINF